MADTCNVYEVSCRFRSDSNGAASCCHRIPCVLKFCHREACPPQALALSVTRELERPQPCFERTKQLRLQEVMETTKHVLRNGDSDVTSFVAAVELELRPSWLRGP
jgi:hypothetical protein